MYITKSSQPDITPSTSSQNDYSKNMFSGLSCTSSTVGTAVIRVRDNYGRHQSVRVLLDSGSQVSAITGECVARQVDNILQLHDKA